MKPTFLTYQKPLLCAMIQAHTPEEALCQIANAGYDGADAYGIHLELLGKEYRTVEKLRTIFRACGDKPIYITSYRGGNSAGFTDEQCAELLLLGLEAGATLCDIIGDLYCKDEFELTFDEEAVKKQKALAAKIHEMGGEVLFSSHQKQFIDEEKVMEIAFAQKERGADVVKIVNHSQNREMLLKNFEICNRLKQELGCEFLYLANGNDCKLLRQIGPALGCCMYLCIQHYLPVSHKVQPKLTAAKAIRDSMFN